jgi:hypothetical protein
VPSLGRSNLLRIFFLFDGEWRATSRPCAPAEVRADVERHSDQVNRAGGPVSVLRSAWSWAFPRRSLEGHFGYMVIAAAQEPPAAEQFLLRVLAQQAGIALAGRGQPDPYPKPPAPTRQRLLRRALDAGQPIRADGRLLALASPREDVLGVLALVDLEARTGDAEKVALEHGAIVLAVELARTLAETELRLGRDLAEELLAGVDAESALMRAQTMGNDLERPYHVVPHPR